MKAQEGLATSRGIALTARARAKDDVLFCELDGELVLLNTATGVYFGLDATGTRIWHLIQEHRSLRPVLEALVAEYDVSAARGEADLLDFVALLEEHALLDVER